MKETNKLIYNGIICSHLFLDFYSEVLFLHNKTYSLNDIFYNGPDKLYQLNRCPTGKPKKFKVRYYISKAKLNETKLQEELLTSLFGGVSSKLEKYDIRYSEVTSDTITENEFTIGGHNLKWEFESHVGKWLWLEISIAEGK